MGHKLLVDASPGDEKQRRVRDSGLLYPGPLLRVVSWFGEVDRSCTGPDAGMRGSAQTNRGLDLPQPLV